MKNENKNFKKGGRGKEFIKRNKAIIQLRKLDEVNYSFGNISEIFNLDKSTVYKIWRRDKDKYDLPDWLKLSTD